MSAIVYASTMIGVRPNVVAPAQRGRPYDHMNRCMFAPTSTTASHVYHIIFRDVTQPMPPQICSCDITIVQMRVSSTMLYVNMCDEVSMCGLGVRNARASRSFKRN